MSQWTDVGRGKIATARLFGAILNRKHDRTKSTSQINDSWQLCFPRKVGEPRRPATVYLPTVSALSFPHTALGGKSANCIKRQAGYDFSTHLAEWFSV